MKILKHNDDCKAREKTLKALKRTIQTGHFDRDNIISLMYAWNKYINQEMDLYKECLELLNTIAQAEEAAKKQP